MKKLMIVLSVIAMTVAANADCTWSWWVGDDKASKDSSGCALGLGVERQAVKGAEISVCWSKAEKVTAGAIGAIGFSQVKTLANGAQVAFVNKAESSALQLGLICMNDTGFLPFFVFFNFDPHQFGSKAKK